MLTRFEGKVAIVTGGAMGLGAAIAHRLADEGARVFIVDLNATKGRDVIGEFPGVGHAFLEADLSKEESIKELARQVATLADGVDVLINNAGISRPGLLEDVTDREWQEVTAINLRAPLLLTKEFISLMRDRSAAIVNVSSEAGFDTLHGVVPVYVISKAGLGGLTRATAGYLWQFGIRVNEVAPGGMVTEMHFGTGPDAEERRRELQQWQFPPEVSIMRRMAEPAEVAAAVAFLASSDASFITASTLHVDGGRGLG